MSYSYTRSISTTDSFTITNARHIASKVAADMHLCSTYYGSPSNTRIHDFATELAQYLKHGYLARYEFGFERNKQRIVTWRYEVDESGLLTTDERAGKVVSYVDVTSGAFYNFLTWNSRYAGLSAADKEAFISILPIIRTPGQPPDDGAGFWTKDKNYGSGGRGLARETFQPYP